MQFYKQPVSNFNSNYQLDGKTDAKNNVVTVLTSGETSKKFTIIIESIGKDGKLSTQEAGVADKKVYCKSIDNDRIDEIKKIIKSKESKYVKKEDLEKMMQEMKNEKGKEITDDCYYDFFVNILKKIDWQETLKLSSATAESYIKLCSIL